MNWLSFVFGMSAGSALTAFLMHRMVKKQLGR